MKSTEKGIVLAVCLGWAQAGAVVAEPSYLIYPDIPTVFRYNTDRFEAIGSDEEKFDPLYAVGNLMLWDRIDNRVPVEIYRAPQLTGFESTAGPSEFVVYSDNFDIVVDGFGRGPRTLGNLYLRFWPDKNQGSPVVEVDGVSTERLMVSLPALEVVTQVEDGFYSDTRVHHVSWSGASALKILAFSDKDGDLKFEGTPVYQINARYTPVPTAQATWGQMKALYR